MKNLMIALIASLLLAGCTVSQYPKWATDALDSSNRGGSDSAN